MMTTSATRLREKLMGFVNVQMQPPHSNIDEVICEAIETEKKESVERLVSEIQEEAMRIVAAPLLEIINQIVVAAKPIVEALETVGNQTDWKDGDETDCVFAWYQIKPLKDAIEFASDKTKSTEKKSEPQAKPVKWFLCTQMTNDGERSGRGFIDIPGAVSRYKIQWDGTGHYEPLSILAGSLATHAIKVTQWLEERPADAID